MTKRQEGPRIRRELRNGGIAQIQPGDVYPYDLLGASRIEALSPYWEICEGRIRDASTGEDVEVVEFVRRIR